MLFESLRAPTALAGALGGPSLEDYLLARHLGIDERLARAIEREGVTQVIEVASGLSARGWRFAQRYGDRLTYVETDLPEMAARKREALERMGSLGERHRVEELDALREEGPASLPAVAAAAFERRQRLAIITEGLIGYLPREQVAGMWRRFAATLGSFRGGVYLSDLHLREELRGPLVGAFGAILSAFVRGRVHIHFRDEPEAEAALAAAGFGDVQLHRPAPGDPAGGRRAERSAALVRILEARRQGASLAAR